MECVQLPLWRDSAIESRLDRYPDYDPGKKQALLVIPGGGYGCVCETTEGRPIAECFQKFGFRTFVLRYRVAPHRYPEPQQDALRAIAKKSIERNTGARGLRSIVEATLRDIMFTAPSDETISKITITADCVNGTGEPVIEHDRKKKPAKKAAKN